MAIGDFHWRVPGSPDPNHWQTLISARGDIHLDTYVEIQVNDAPEVWQLLPNGHRTVVLSGQAIVAIEQGSGTIPGKRQAVMDLITVEVLSWGLAQSYQGAAAFVALLPGGEWPVNDVTALVVL